jgi:transmembrane sensor
MKNFKTYWQKFFKGELSREEGLFFMHWFNSKQGREAFKSLVEETYENVPLDDAGEWDTENSLKELLKKKPEDPHSHHSFSFNGFFRYAAAFAFVIGLSYLFIDIVYNPSQEEVAEEVEHLPVLLTRENPKGQKSKFVLPDSTVVYLNADSKLSYWEGFTGGREVELSGEAFFEIASDTLRPFVVKSGRLSTKALGTSFNVQAYEESPVLQVTLASGKVSVEDQVSRKVMLMDPGESALVKLSDQEPKKIRSDPRIISLWKDGILHFDKTPLEEVIPTLERWYGVKIKIMGDLPNHKCTGTFKKNEYLSNVLRVLGHNVGFNYTIEGKEVSIYLKP